ncbi:hypothetical protein PsorP6_002521 [Peronosclerospora sorghi]|uniref:Uncharacterized protein n=1 Tax=Peronosclerospora sorghi TaxID=230839 RepID=A0ACC0WW28_9STRA|nr:hypothetical protein PsorP6_002521 [Peronosclerospora sorghi]
MPLSYYRYAMTAPLAGSNAVIMLRSPDHKVLSPFRSGANFARRLGSVLEHLPKTVEGVILASLGLTFYALGSNNFY